MNDQRLDPKDVPLVMSFLFGPHTRWERFCSAMSHIVCGVVYAACGWDFNGFTIVEPWKPPLLAHPFLSIGAVFSEWENRSIRRRAER